MILLLQQTLGVTEALKSAMNPAVELTMSIEKLLLQTMAADNGTSGAITQVRSKTIILKCIIRNFQCYVEFLIYSVYFRYGNYSNAVMSMALQWLGF